LDTIAGAALIVGVEGESGILDEVSVPVIYRPLARTAAEIEKRIVSWVYVGKGEGG
jgi:hypothetical protein